MRPNVARSAAVVALIACGSAAILSAQSRRPQGLLGVGTPSAATAAAPATPSAADPFFDDSVLQELSLDINAKDWATLKENFESNAYYPADLRWRGEVVRNVGIRARGTSSRSGTKPGLRVDFNLYSTGQTFLGLKSFVLRNNVTDATNMHERISMLFFRKMGIPAPRETHARLTINGAYAGLYSIVESLDQTFLAANYGSDSGYLYKFDRNVDDPPYYFQYLGPDPAAYVPHPFEPETHESDPHPQPIVDMIRTVQEASPAAFRSAIAGLIDVTQFVRYIAVEMFLETTTASGECRLEQLLSLPSSRRRAAGAGAVGQKRSDARWPALSDPAHLERRAGRQPQPSHAAPDGADRSARPLLQHAERGGGRSNRTGD
jgi:hypothetical protein